MTKPQKHAEGPKTEANGGKNERAFAAGEFIFEEGQVGDFAYVLVSGELEITKLTKGDFIKLQDVKKGNLFGEMALIDKSVRSASARAVTDVVVREIDENALMVYIKQSPDVAMNMMYRLANYARSTAKTLENRSFGQSPEGKGAASGRIENEDIGDDDRILKWDTNADHIINEFQSSQIEIEKSKIPPLVQHTFLFIVLLIGAFITWATVSVIDTTISASGRLSTTVPTISVQATDNSVVKEMRVAIGQRVRQGEVLVTLDETYAEADLARAEIESNLLNAKIQRLMSEMNKEGEKSSEKMENSIERTIFLNRIKEYSSRIASLELKMRTLSHKIEMTSSDIKLAKEQLEIQQSLEQARKTLYDREIGSLVNLLEARNNRLSTERDYNGLQYSLNNLKSEIESIRAEKQAFISGWFSKIGVELSQATKERDSNAEDLVKLRRRKENINILSPADGVIIEMENLFVGAIVNEGSAIMSLVPSNVPLTVELDIDPRDISNLIFDADVSIKLGALPYQKHGELLGKISFISEDTVDQSLDGEKGTFYRARSSIISNELRDIPGDFRLVPGMLLTGDIKAGRRRLITYFIYPVIRTIQTSFSEPGR